ncbi:MAG: hypothetical protein P8X57_07975 [Cyclobacteriaceae bacterium]
MIRSILTMVCVSILFSGCKDETNEARLLEGEWYLKERLADPGNGSGTYQPVDSDLVLKFLPKGTFVSTEPLCNEGDKGGRMMNLMFIHPVAVLNSGTRLLKRRYTFIHHASSPAD